MICVYSARSRFGAGEALPRSHNRSADPANTSIKAAPGHSGGTCNQTGCDPDKRFAETLEQAGRPIEPALASFRALLLLLDHLPDSLQRFVILKAIMIPDGKKLTVEYLLRSQVNHIPHHIDQIASSRATTRAG